VGGLVFYSLQGFVGAVERVGLDSRLDADLACELEKVECVLPSHVGDAANLAFAPEKLVIVEGGHLIEVDCVDGEDAAFAKAGQCADNDGSAGREGNGAIKIDGGLSFSVPTQVAPADDACWR
jgi:hypothetical protein